MEIAGRSCLKHTQIHPDLQNHHKPWLSDILSWNEKHTDVQKPWHTDNFTYRQPGI